MSETIIHCAGQGCPHLHRTGATPPNGDKPYTDICRKARRELGSTYTRLGYAPEWCPLRKKRTHKTAPEVAELAPVIDTTPEKAPAQTKSTQKKASPAKKPAARKRAAVRGQK